MTLRVALLDPYGDDPARGNAVAASRIAASLRSAGHEVRRVVSLGTPFTRARRELAAFDPHVIHAFHAFRAGPLGRELAVALGRPLVVSFRGTDAVLDPSDT